ncbi:MAG TPA: hypothetical protein VMS96_06335 [Terriglobales bacterium]|nr:hypothetical protein [Terriglobales bacterium]
MRKQVQAALVLAVVVSASFAVMGQNPPTGATKPSNGNSGIVPHSATEAQALVRTAIQNQLDEDEKPGGPAFRYTLREHGKRGILTKEMIQTKEGVVARLVAIDDRPLTAEERQADDEKLDNLLRDAQTRAKKLKEQKEDEKRTRKMVGALPDAFQFEPDGTVEGPRGPLVRVKFKPNPNFDPPSRELQVFQGMAGTMLIDPRAKRLAEIDGKLFRSVNFGWGILGHLDKDGQFMVQQSDVTGNGNWEITHMKLNFDGKVLIFKSIHIRDDDQASNFRIVPNDLTLAQGIELLRKQKSAVAEKQ